MQSFFYRWHRAKYRKLIEQMEIDLLQRKILFPKTLADAFRILAGWKSQYGTKDSRTTEANDGKAFATTSSEDKREIRGKR